MNDSHRQLIKERYENAVHEYVLAFCRKHGYHYDPDEWIGDNVGGIVMIADYYINFDNIRYDIDNDVPAEVFVQFYDYTLRLAMLDEEKHVNYPHYIMGFRPYSEEQMQKMEESKRHKDEADAKLDESRNHLGAQTDEMDFINKEGEQ